MINIDKEIPIPLRKPRKNTMLKGATKYMRSMNVGDSFVIPFNERSGLYQIAKNIGIVLQTKKESDGLIRVWRIA